MGENDTETAYAVGQINLAHITSYALRVMNEKIGLTHPKIRAHRRIDQPDFGTFFSDIYCEILHSCCITTYFTRLNCADFKTGFKPLDGFYPP